MISLNNKISNRQLQLFLILDILGTKTFFLPRVLSNISGNDSWISAIIGVFFACISMYLIASVGKCFPNDSFVTYLFKTVSSPIGYIIALVFVIKIIFVNGLALRIFGETTRQIIIPNTPLYIIILSMILISFYSSSKGIESRARIYELLIGSVLIFVISILFSAKYNSDFSNILPIGTTNPLNILKGGIFTFFTFSAMEYTLLIYPFINNSKKTRQSSIIAILIVGTIITLTTIIAIAKFTANSLSRQIWPVFEMLNSINLPGSFVERQEAFSLSFWIIMVFASTSAGLFFSAVIMKDLFKKLTHTKYIFISAITMFIISILPIHLPLVVDLLHYVDSIFGLFYMVILPIVLLFIIKIRKLR